MKKKFTVPLVFLTTASPNGGGGGSHTGGGNIQSTQPFPCRFEEWQQSRWLGDYDQNGAVDMNDYAKWWAQCGFGVDTWNQYNPSVSWKDEWSS